MHPVPATRAVLVAIAVLTALAGRVDAIVTVDRAAAIVVYPYLFVDTANGQDMFLQLSNASTQPIDVHCFYENAGGSCSAAPSTFCRVDFDCPVGSICVPGWQINDFQIRLTAGQPLGWAASSGQLTLPCSGAPCPGGTNVGGIPPLPANPFIGALRCIALTPGDAPSEANALEGLATVERFQAGADVPLDVSKYTAVGIEALEGANDGNRTLDLGGPTPEYEACPNILSFNHLFENATEPIRHSGTVSTELVLLPCTADYALQQPTSLVVQYLVFNEFEQRLGTATRLVALQADALSSIHPRIFAVGVQGTLAGQTRVIGVTDDSRTNAGLLGLVIERHDGTTSAMYAPDTVGDRSGGDVLFLGP